MKQGIADLIEISQYYGKQKDFVIAGGGNTSFKMINISGSKPVALAWLQLGKQVLPNSTGLYWTRSIQKYTRRMFSKGKKRSKMI